MDKIFQLEYVPTKYINNYHYLVNKKSKEYYSSLTLFCLIIGCFIWAITKYSTESPWNNLLTYHSAVAIAPVIIIYLLISNLVIKPKIKVFKEKLWVPLGKEQKRLKDMENYVNSLSRETRKEYCYCENCLEIGWKKTKNTIK